MFSLREGDSETVVVSVMSNAVTLDRDVIVTVITADGTATAASSIQFCASLYSCYVYNTSFSLFLLSLFLFSCGSASELCTLFSMYTSATGCVAVVLCTLYVNVCKHIHVRMTVIYLPLCVHISTDDYIAVLEVLTFNSSSLSHNVMVIALADTVSGEGDELFSLSLTGDDPAVMLMMSTANVTIIDASKLV